MLKWYTKLIILNHKGVCIKTCKSGMTKNAAGKCFALNTDINNCGMDAKNCNDVLGLDNNASNSCSNGILSIYL
jgi:hypothetical protein